MCYYGGMKSSLSQLTAGVCIVAVGALLLLDTLHITDGALGTATRDCPNILAQ